MGLLSKNLIEEHGIPYIDISNLSVQDRRDSRKVGNRLLHDYVPLFIAERTPMMYKLIKRDDIDRRKLNLLVISPGIILSDGVYFSNGNVASEDTTCYSNDNLEKLEELNWFLIRSGSWNDPDEEIKRIQKLEISAEVLIPDQVSPQWIVKIIPYDRKKRSYFF